MSLAREQLLAETRRVLKSSCGVDGEIAEDSRLGEDLRLDSVGMLSLAVNLENRYRIRLVDDPASPPRTVGDVLDILEQAMLPPLASALFKAWKQGGEKRLAFVDFDGLSHELSYAEFQAEVRLTSERLRALGVVPGVVVALLGPTSRELCRAAAAVWCSGATLTVLAIPSRLSSLEGFLMETLSKLAQSRAGLFLGEKDMVEAFREMLSIPVLSWEELEQGTPRGEVASAGVEAALIQFSSGTTRDPQPILLSAEALLANAGAVLAQFPGGADQHSCVSWLPLYHDMGLIGCFLMPMLAPGDLTLMGPEVFVARPSLWLETISKRRATTSSAPNFALAYCADRVRPEQVEGLDLSCWSIAMVGAEPVRPATLRRFSRIFAPLGFDERAFSPVYGLAEATLAVTFSPLGEGLKTLSYDPQSMATDGLYRDGSLESPSLGRPLAGIELEIRDQSGSPLEEGRLGEVYLRGPSLMSGYLGGDGAASRLGDDGWLRTGDMGFLYRGELHLYGRRRDILLIDGRNHDPSLLEGVLESLPPLRRCCAFTHEFGPERDGLVLACEVKSDFAGPQQPLRDQILALTREHSGLLVSDLLLLEPGSLPVTSSGKLRRQEAAKHYAGGRMELWKPSINC